MTTPEAGGLLPNASMAKRATFLELFFDLVYVFAFTRIAARAFEDLAEEPAHGEVWRAVTGGGKTLLLLFALWGSGRGPRGPPAGTTRTTSACRPS